MANRFQKNAAVAHSHVRAQQIKGWFMANAQVIAVILSGMMLWMGVILMYSGVHLRWDAATGYALLAALPVALIAAPLAILIEGMTIVAANGWRENRRKIEQEIGVVNKVKKGFTAEEKAIKLKQIKKQGKVPAAILLGFSFFSLAGAEIFWHTITLDAAPFFQVIGYIVGAVVSVSLTYLEVNHDLVERGVDRSISSSAMIYRAMEMDAKGQILDQFGQERSRELMSPEFVQTLQHAAHSSLFGVLSESISHMGASISAEQLRRIVESKAEERAAAENFIANGGDVILLPEVSSDGRKTYKTAAQMRVKDLQKKYSKGMILDDLERFAEEAQVSVNTLKKYVS